MKIQDLLPRFEIDMNAGEISSFATELANFLNTVRVPEVSTNILYFQRVESSNLIRVVDDTDAEFEQFFDPSEMSELVVELSKYSKSAKIS